MPYDSVVLVKQVPDTSNITGQVMKADGTVNRAALPAVFNPDDLYALEQALAVKDAYGGTKYWEPGRGGKVAPDPGLAG